MVLKIFASRPFSHGIKHVLRHRSNTMRKSGEQIECASQMFSLSSTCGRNVYSNNLFIQLSGARRDVVKFKWISGEFLFTYCFHSEICLSGAVVDSLVRCLHKIDAAGLVTRTNSHAHATHARHFGIWSCDDDFCIN